MAVPHNQNSTKLTYELVDGWREELFDNRTLRVPVEQLNKWPLVHYLWAVVLQANRLDSMRESHEENWQTPAWDFGRFAKAHPALINLGENKALVTIRSTIGTQFWKEHLHMEPADAEMAFDNVWNECRAVPGYDPLKLAILEATQKARPNDAATPVGYSVFIGVARSLQRLVGDVAFLLPCHKLAPLLKCQPMTISRYRQKAIRDGHLKVVKDHSYRAKGKGEATEFRFVETQSRA